MLIKFLALGFGTGLAPKAPGTFGTLAALPLFYFMHTMTPLWYWSLLVLLFVIGIYLCGAYSREMGVHDDPSIVWDEIVGYLITLGFVPFDWVLLVIGFIYFRFFDIVKPWPIRWLDQHVEGGLGIMIDDVLAGIMAGLCLWGTYYAFFS